MRRPYLSDTWIEVLAYVLAGALILGMCGILMGLGTLIAYTTGTNGFGPTRSVTVQVISKHVDVSDKSSSYMVTTSAGTFEVDNGPLLDVYNADELYGKLLVNTTYCMTIRGNTVTNFWLQQYPYVLKYASGPCGQ